MATKKKAKAQAKPKAKAKSATRDKKKASKSSKKKATAKPKNRATSKVKKAASKPAASKKAGGKKAAKKVKKEKVILPPGPDLQLVPVKGEIHPAQVQDSKQFEKVFRHNEEVALRAEQQRAKQILARTGGRIFRGPR